MPAAFLLAFVPGTYAKAILGKKYMDLANPRKFEAAIESNEEIDKVVSLPRIQTLAATLSGPPGRTYADQTRRQKGGSFAAWRRKPTGWRR